ncbi:alpha/beta hydrolase [Hymenobacter cellulosivorans]|uniref:Dienelactone hydrolase family protein n=1 Tax=Hymenobacter cellulosivorans TaxID=2932249 RepID=A0ABY4F7Q4_9BACT|nr:alpha/beta fold hydrolase [Hymenobacter cellulosivorans]UOQ52702.1 dienelactone hydrolase family protein [Hymenobacter cellulosivorans]
MTRKSKPIEFILETVTLHGVAGNVEELTLHTNHGEMPARFHPAQPTAPVVVWVGGAGGGLDGPACGLYPRLAAQLSSFGIASLRVHYRRPNYLEECVADTLLAVQYVVQQRQAPQVALVGHSFGGAVVIAAGALSAEVTAVVAMSSQTYGTDLAPQLSPRPLLLLHGTADEILPAACSELIFARAREPKELVLYPDCCHGLDECREQVDRDVVAWLRQQLAAPHQA